MYCTTMQQALKTLGLNIKEKEVELILKNNELSLFKVLN